MKLFILTTLLFCNQLLAAHICYFSLNNEKEFKVMDEFTKRLNQLSNLEEKITVEEYLTENGEPEKAFEKMVSSGKQCDGLVISGHHTGSFGGKRSAGNLGIDFMEKISCDPKYKSFFENIKALWLQGCRTLGQKVVIDSNTNPGCQDANCHRDRVGAVLDEDHLTQSLADLEFEFSDTLDQDNPLSSRYLRVFPRATVFGWTKTAPGVKARSEFSIPFHMANIVRITDDRKIYFKGPTSVNQRDAKAFTSIIFKILNKDQNDQCDECWKTIEGDAVDAWLAHGQAKTGKNGRKLKIDRKISFSNDDLQAFPSLLSSNDELLFKAQKLNCILKQNPISEEKLFQTIDEILKDERLIGYNFNSLYEALLNPIKSGNFDLLDKVRQKFNNSQVLTNFMMRKLEDKSMGSLRKIDYFGFYKRMTGKEFPKIDQQIIESAKKLLLTSTEGDYSRIDYNLTLIQSLIKNKFISSEFLFEMLEKNPSQITLLTVVKSIKKSIEIPPVLKDAEKLLEKVLTSDQINNEVLYEAIKLLGVSLKSNGIKNIDKYLKLILDSKHFQSYNLQTFISDIVNLSSVKDIKDFDKILEMVVKSKHCGKGNSTTMIVQTLALNELDIKNSDKILKYILEKNDPNLNHSYLLSMVQNKNSPFYHAIYNHGVLEKILNSSSVNVETINNIKILFSKDFEYFNPQYKPLTENEKRNLNLKISTLEKGNEELKSLAEKILKSHRPNLKDLKAFEEMIKSNIYTKDILEDILNQIASQKYKISFDKVFDALLKSPKLTSNKLAEFLNKLQQLPILDVYTKLIHKIIQSSYLDDDITQEIISIIDIGKIRKIDSVLESLIQSKLSENGKFNIFDLIKYKAKNKTKLVKALFKTLDSEKDSKLLLYVLFDSLVLNGRFQKDVKAFIKDSGKYNSKILNKAISEIIKSRENMSPDLIRKVPGFLKYIQSFKDCKEKCEESIKRAKEKYGID